MNKNTKVHLFFSFDHIHNYLTKKSLFQNCIDKEKNYVAFNLNVVVSVKIQNLCLRCFVIIVRNSCFILCFF